MSLKDRVSRVVVRVPATTANLGPGFDVHGLALNVMYDVVEAEKIEAGLTIEVEGRYAKEIPTSPKMNTAGKVVFELQRMFRGR
ncbi:TPA: homoserine kinase, partial [Candidatus Bathyarchaeota archaeon]|nr:homoserine kinase [Candidatus Bathyarchaeota archaeon]